MVHVELIHLRVPELKPMTMFRKKIAFTPLYDKALLFEMSLKPTLYILMNTQIKLHVSRLSCLINDRRLSQTCLNNLFICLAENLHYLHVMTLEK